jgi:hypothetical protein
MTIVVVVSIVIAIMIVIMTPVPVTLLVFFRQMAIVPTRITVTFDDLLVVIDSLISIPADPTGLSH